MSNQIPITTHIIPYSIHAITADGILVAIPQSIDDGPANLVGRRVELRTNVRSLQAAYTPLVEILAKMVAESLTSDGVRDTTVREAMKVLNAYTVAPRPVTPLRTE